MAKRNPANDINLLKEQYKRLVNAVDGFYAGDEFQALNIAVTLRVLVHKTRTSHPLLARLDRAFWDLTIQHQPLNPKSTSIFCVPIALRISGDGISRVVRSDFASPNYQLVPMLQWWKHDYQPIGTIRLSKERIILNAANRAGGAHVDDTVPDAHVALAQPPFYFGTDNGGEKTLMQPNIGYGIVAQAGCEMQDCLERHFPVK
jgi:hypothetical protein